MNVVGFCISNNEVLLEKIEEINLFKQYDGVRGVALDSEHSVRETMIRVFYESTGQETGADEWTFFAEFIEPIAKRRTCYLFNKGVRLYNLSAAGNHLVEYDMNETTGDVLLAPHVEWMYNLAMSWDECGYENVVMLEKRKRENKTIQAPASRIYRPSR